MPKPELVDVKAKKVGETKLAFRLFDGVTTDWVPKRYVEENDDGTYTMPEWLAEEKEFLVEA